MTPVQRAKQELYHACIRGSAELVASALNLVPEREGLAACTNLDPAGNSALHLAALHGHLRVVQALVQHVVQWVEWMATSARHCMRPVRKDWRRSS